MIAIKGVYIFPIFAFVLILMIPITIVFVYGNVSDLELYDNLDKENVVIEYLSVDKLLNDLDDDNIHYLYLGKPECPWCQEYLPIYNNYAKDKSETILYFNPSKIDSLKEVKKDGKVMLAYNDDYQKLIDFLTKNLVENVECPLKDKTFTSSNGDKQSMKWIYVPRLLKIENGLITDVLSTVEGHVIIDDNDEKYLPKLTDEQKCVLIQKLDQMFLGKSSVEMNLED